MTRNIQNKLKYLLTISIFLFSYSSFAQDNPQVVAVNDSQNAANDIISKNYVIRVDNLVNKFEAAYQFARTAPAEAKLIYLSKMNSIFEEFTKLKYNSDNAMVMELKKLVNTWMDKRLSYVDKSILEFVYLTDYSTLLNTADLDYMEQVYKTKAAGKAFDEGNGVYNEMMTQMNKVKSFYSI
jgi:hypothetical protein